MADQITAKDSGGGGFKPHPEGQFGAVCVDVIDLGERLKSWKGKDKVAHQCALVFLTGEVNEETGQLHDVHAEFTVSMFAQASLRLFLEAWRGKPYTDEQAKEGVPLHKLAGKPALISVSHKTAIQSGRSYATIQAIMPLPKGMVAPDVNLEGYERATFWEQRKEGYRAELANFLSRNAPKDDDYAGVPANGVDDMNSLPF